MNHVLVTGGAGYIGSHLCKTLKSVGIEPVSVDNLVTGFSENVRWGPLVELDLRDYRSMVKKLDDFRFSAIFHLAASAYVGESQQNPLKYYENNLSSTINIIKYQIEHDIPNLVFASSCSVYGSTDSKSISETDLTLPTNVYAETKLICEKIISNSLKKTDKSWAILRYFNVSGVDPEGDIGERHEPETHLIPRIINCIRNGNTLDVYGESDPSIDLTPIRDFVHVSDIARGNLLALKFMQEKGESQIFNLGSGRGNSVLDIINHFRSMGYTLGTRFSPPRNGDPKNLVSDISKAKQLLNWQPESSKITNIIQSYFKLEPL
jgi:UDP-arabinose 4-epimerase